ncbi:abortive infection family protein [Fusobacteria bacterium ZRK30]|nr:abortive infection family protein [Fusobacteria bacterium ZRK30]
MAKFDLKIKNRMDKLFIEGGYVLDFSNNSFQNFVLESVDEDIYDEKYDGFGGSKGNRLKGFWKNENIDKIIKLSLDLLDHWDSITNERGELSLKSYEICKSYFENLSDTGYKLVKTTIEEKLDDSILSHKFISEQIEKSNKKIAKADYSGAITNSRTLIEQVLKELSLRFKLEIDNSGDLQKLYKVVANKMNLKIAKDSPENIKQILSGFLNIINGIAPLRNSASDAHARMFDPKKHHAKLAVNSSLTICDFLLDSYEYQSKK